MPWRLSEWESLIHRKRLTGIIDWEFAHIGNPLEDIDGSAPDVGVLVTIRKRLEELDTYQILWRVMKH